MGWERGSAPWNIYMYVCMGYKYMVYICDTLEAHNIRKEWSCSARLTGSPTQRNLALKGVGIRKYERRLVEGDLIRLIRLVIRRRKVGKNTWHENGYVHTLIFYTLTSCLRSEDKSLAWTHCAYYYKKDCFERDSELPLYNRVTTQCYQGMKRGRWVRFSLQLWLWYGNNGFSLPFVNKLRMLCKL